MKNNNLAIIGASYLQLPLIAKAKEKGYITHVFAWKVDDVGEKVADYFYPISIINKEEILKKCKEIRICGICSIASDIAVITVNYVATKMGLCGNDIASTGKCTNKYLMRKAFEMNGDPSPKSVLVNDILNLDLLNLEYPVIVKPIDRSGSRGVYKLDSSNGLKDAVISAMNESFEKKALVEEYVEGQEYSVEYISYRGEHHFLALTYKYTTGAPFFIERGHMQPAKVDDKTLGSIKKIIVHALNTLEIKNGASHSEIKIDDNGNVKIIEIGARMGGDCIGSDLVRYSTGYDFVGMVIDVACGKEIVWEKKCEPIKVESRFILTNDDLKNFENIKYNESEKILQVVDYHPERIGKVTDSSNRAGCYIIKVD